MSSKSRRARAIPVDGDAAAAPAITNLPVGSGLAGVPPRTVRLREGDRERQLTAAINLCAKYRLLDPADSGGYLIVPAGSNFDSPQPRGYWKKVQ